MGIAATNERTTVSVFSTVSSCAGNICEVVMSDPLLPDVDPLVDPPLDVDDDVVVEVLPPDELDDPEDLDDLDDLDDFELLLLLLLFLDFGRRERC